MLNWSCVEVDPKDAQGLGDALLRVSVRPDRGHNVIDEVSPELIYVSVGEPQAHGRANRELMGFLRTLLGLEPDKLCLESGEKKAYKTLKASGLAHDKRDLLWLLQAKVGKQHEVRFAAEHAAAARAASDKEAARKRKDIDEYQKLKEEASAQPLPLLEVSALRESTAVKKALPSMIKVKRRAADAQGESEDPPAKRPATDPAAPAVAAGTKDPAPLPGLASAGEDTGGLGISCLTQYDSDSDE
mmetsp:Transcript_9102/g.20722  ORF Transcript_9102/g.20722 Transcript_9102/m.20722 type:complete len:244 (-) Transcript_9102:77-808(-)